MTKPTDSRTDWESIRNSYEDDPGGYIEHDEL